MKVKLYDVRLRTDAATLPTVLSVLEGTCDLLDIKQVEPTLLSSSAMFPKTVRKLKMSYEAGKRDKGITGARLFDEFLALRKSGTQFHTQEVSRLFAARQFKQTSASPIVSAAVAAGRIRKLGDGLYEKI